MGEAAGAGRRHRRAARARQRPHRRRSLQPRLHAALEPGPAGPVGQPLRAIRAALRRRLRLPQGRRQGAEHAPSRPPRGRRDLASLRRRLLRARACGPAASRSARTSTRRSATTRCSSHDVTIRNLSDRTRRVSWFEYWDVNPYDQYDHAHRGLASPSWKPASRTLSVAQASGEHGRPPPAEHLRRRPARSARRPRDVRLAPSSAPGRGPPRPRSRPTGSAARSQPPRRAARPGTPCSPSAPRFASAPASR